jgi:hypothetical protein
MEDITTGKPGEQMREQFNRMGILDSGAFNSELADIIGRQGEQENLSMKELGLNQNQDLQDVMRSAYGQKAGLSNAYLGREFGLQDLNAQIAAQQNALSQQRQDRTSGLLGGGLGAAGGALLGNMLVPGLGGIIGGSLAGGQLGQGLFGGK